MKLLMTLLAVAMLVATASAGYIGRGGWSSPLYYSRSYAPSYGGWGGYGGYGGYGGWRGGYSGWGGSGYGGWNRGWSGGWW